MIQKENAIKKAEEDLLGRGKFIERISEAIVSYSSDENLIIGLEGKWGSGKTSILNLIEENLKDEVEIFRFSPWNFISRKQLVSDFFDQFSYFLGDSRHDFKSVGECLKKMAYLLKPVKYYSGVAGDFVKMLESALNGTRDFLTEELNFEKIKQRINKILLENDKKIIVMIDDIDRLSDNEIIEIFQLVKGAGEFKKVIYILAYDHELVKNSLDIISKNRGQEYLEKIVQIQIEVPTVEKKYLEEKFLSELENIFSGKHITNEFNLFYEKIIKQEIVDIRKLEKILNNIRFGMDYAEKNLNLEEYILLKTLKV
ncbi:MAG: KAP family P-loop NTPase fold protein, partial [Cetobacterium sp.]